MRWGYWGLIGLTMLFGVWLTWINWQRQSDMLRSTLRVESAFLADATSGYLQHYESLMWTLAGDLQSQPDLLSQPQDLQAVLQRYRALLSPDQALAINLVLPNGQVFATTLSSRMPLPNFRNMPDIWDGMNEAAQHKDMEVGKAVYGPMLHRWIIPLRLAVKKEASAKAQFFIVVPVELNDFLERWQRSVVAAQHAMPGTSIALMRADGYLLARWPAPNASDLGAFYNTRRTGALAQSVLRNPQALSGQFDGLVEADQSVRIGAWVRLPAHGVLVNMTVPRALLWRDFWRTSWPALATLAAWLVLLSLTYRILRRQFERDRMQLRDRADIMYRLANQDSLTGLLNRRGLGEHLQRAHDLAQQEGVGFSLVLFDLDHFKLINDGFGHPAGDAVLQQIAHLLQTRMRKEDQVARWGGEEFLVLLPESDLETGRITADKLRDLVAHTRMAVGGAELRLTASFGVSAWDPQQRLSIAELLGQCDSALYNAKEGARNRVCVFQGKTAQDYLQGFALKRAIEDDRIRVAYQPLVSIASGQIMGFEALARLVTESGETVTAAQFIDVANRLRMEHRIDSRVSRQVLSRCSRRVGDGGPPMKYMINCSADFLSRPEDVQQLLDRAQHYCESCGLPTTVLEKPMVIEITERQLIGDAEAVLRLVQPLIDFGFQLAVDDFGSGYSSYLYVLKLPVSYLKIEAELVREASRSPRAEIMVRNIHSMAHELGIKTIAEGIEDEQTLDVMRRIGIDWGQGYYWGQPEIEH
jgi:diguanylate cyclase (GGDEF)-like protein